jgi:hypothetical protein
MGLDYRRHLLHNGTGKAVRAKGQRHARLRGPPGRAQHANHGRCFVHGFDLRITIKRWRSVGDSLHDHCYWLAYWLFWARVACIRPPIATRCFPANRYPRRRQAAAEGCNREAGETSYALRLGWVAAELAVSLDGTRIERTFRVRAVLPVYLRLLNAWAQCER